MQATLLAITVLAGCREDLPQALGTLEYDRITLPAPAAERIVAIDVHEGERVVAGARLLTLEHKRSEAEGHAARAEAERQREILSELEAGPRSEDIEQSAASLAALKARERDARAQASRFESLGRKHLVAAAEVDRTRAA
ncbi:MAG: hemolysin secretion protein D, partial [Lysobacterales bacterium]